jgi:acetyl esterase/lipase
MSRAPFRSEIRSDHSQRNLGRREFLANAAAQTAALVAAPAGLLAQGKQRPRARVRPLHTFTYKQVGPLAIQADVYRANDTVSRPILLSIHGGALIMGNRGGLGGPLQELFLKAGYAVVSIDYRLAPETKLPQIIEDVRDAYAWLRDKGPELFHADTRRIVVTGGSAGGYLTLMTGFAVTPRPAALLSLWGFGDITADWESRPSEFYRKGRLVTKEEARAGVGTVPLADGFTGGRNRGRFYLYCRQQGLWPQEVAGLDPRTQDSQFSPYCPLRNVTKNYPPTLFIHGTKDTDVPFEQSAQMDQALARNSVEHKLIAIANAGHGIGNGDPKQVAAAYAEAFAFADRHVRAT